MAEYGESGKKKGGVAWRVVFVIALIVFLASIAVLGVVAFSYLQGQWKYGDVAESADFDPGDLDRKELAEVNVDWDALRAVNPNTVAWLFIPGTNINYPVVKGADNEYYLTHDFDGAQGWLANYGAVFMDFHNNPDWSDASYFIYGHHMNDGSMFADLAGFANQERFDECRTVYLLTPTGNFKLRTYAMCHVSSDAAIVQSNFATPEDMTAYVQDKMNRSVVNAGDVPPAAEITKSFALATCDNLYSDGRYILFSYVDGTSTEGLTGDLGIQTDDGHANGFVNDLTVEDQKG